MTGFTRLQSESGATDIRFTLQHHEALVLQDVADQLALLVRGYQEDEAMRRLFPSAYEDAELATEFAQLTGGDLRAFKSENAAFVRDSLGSALEQVGESVDDVSLELNADQTMRLLTFMTDVRLMLSERMRLDADPNDPDEGTLRQGLYDWLGWLQDSLVTTLEN